MKTSLTALKAAKRRERFGGSCGFDRLEIPGLFGVSTTAARTDAHIQRCRITRRIRRSSISMLVRIGPRSRVYGSTLDVRWSSFLANVFCGRANLESRFRALRAIALAVCLMVFGDEDVWRGGSPRRA